MPETVVTKALKIPRGLAIRLLESAQRCADRPVCILVTAESATAPPDGLERLPAGTALAEGVAAVTTAGRVLWAVFEYAPNAAAEPPATSTVSTLHLTASLEIRGVLQLHAWTQDAAAVCEVPLRLVD